MLEKVKKDHSCAKKPIEEKDEGYFRKNKTNTLNRYFSQ